ncbi:MAG: transcriptional repressor LexA [Clostridia bacterium]|nr:transcriptional repressor LexA [Clostridia bacterium]
MSKVQEKINNVFEFMQGYIRDNGFPPSVREICASVGIKSTATCHAYLKKLEENGLITVGDNKKRAIMLTNSHASQAINVPLIGTITAGTPIFAYENLEEYCPLPSEFGDEKELFMLRVKGDSMIEAGIFNGDRVIVRKQETCKNGEIAIAFYEDSATVKRFYKKEGHIVLHPENSTMQDIILPDVQILGIVVGLIRKY